MVSEQYDLVIPCTDEWALALDLHRDRVSAAGRVYLLDRELLRLVRDKFEMNSLARAAGLRVPYERIVRNIGDLEGIPAEFSLPVVLKPPVSVELADLSVRHEVRMAFTWSECSKYACEYLQSGPFSVQEYVIGTDVGVEVLIDHGVPLLVFQHKYLREPPRGGSGGLREGVLVQPELLNAATTLLAAIGYAGVAMLDFRVDYRTGDWAFLEVNGRFWGSLPLAVTSGADFPIALYEFLVEGRREFDRRYRTGLRCRNLTDDFWWLDQVVRDPEVSRIGKVTTVVREVGAAVANVVTGRERSDTLVLDDARPGLSELGAIGAIVRNSVVRKLLRRWWLCRPGRQYLRRRAIRAVLHARTFLFICKGNVCRSPFAELVARDLFGEHVDVISAGYLDLPPRNCPEYAVAAASSMGLDLSTHVSRPLRDVDISRADVAFVFDLEDVVELAARYPSLRHRFHLLGALDPPAPLFIPDPWDSGEDNMRATYRRIAKAVQSLCPHRPISGPGGMSPG
jgi:protein-tyrosine-phosphatase/predicted ATP-grasp superfamily ATP-dependent carboligase